jgi:hypothetical protein
MAVPTANDVAQRPLDQNNKEITGVPVPLVPGSPVTVPQMNSRSLFSGSISVGAGPGAVVNILPGLAIPPGFARLWSAMHPTDGSGTSYIFGNCPSSVLFIRFTKLGSGLVSVDLVNNHTSPHTIDWAVGYVTANPALLFGTP